MSDPAEDVAPIDVRETYETIGEHFSQTRAHPWPEVEGFVEDADSVSVGLDVGCGNGRHASVLGSKAENVLALDASRTLLMEAVDRLGAPGGLLQGDATRLPIGDSRVGLAVYVATLHHLPEREHRRASLNELARVLGPDGRGLVSVWSTAHDRFEADADASRGFDTTIDWTLPTDEIVQRFYHIYAPAEFEQELTTSELVVERVRVSSGNCYAEVSGRS